MAYTHYDRLSALDAAFLDMETAEVHMHVGAVAIFDGEGLLGPDGGLDIERVRAAADPILRASPRFRQRLEHVPLLGHPVWVDDDRFNPLYHLRHTALPAPGDERQLQRLAGRIFSQQLDRGKPLWEMWFVEGLEGGRFAAISKIHHCMVDGISGIDLLQALVADGEGAERRPRERRWLPRPRPLGARLLAEELTRRASAPWRAAGELAEAARHPGVAWSAVREVTSGLADATRAVLHPATPTPLNSDIGPYRRFDWARTPLDGVKEVRRRLGGTVNDVVLAAVAGALRRYLRSRGVAVRGLDFRVLVPVNVRAPDERGELGNRVAFVVAPLPLAESSPTRRLLRIAETTAALKRGGQRRGTELLEKLGDWTFPSLVSRYARLGAATGAFNLVVTNVPGLPRSARLLGARLLELYPLVPLYTRQALGIALVSYDGTLHWGFHGDWEALPDLHDLVEDVKAELEVLQKAAGNGSGDRRPRGRS